MGDHQRKGGAVSQSEVRWASKNVTSRWNKSGRNHKKVSWVKSIESGFLEGDGADQGNEGSTTAKNTDRESQLDGE